MALSVADFLKAAEQILPAILSLEAGAPLSEALPAESVSIDLSKYGLGKFDISESGATAVIKKVA